MTWRTLNWSGVTPEGAEAYADSLRERGYVTRAEADEAAAEIKTLGRVLGPDEIMDADAWLAARAEVRKEAA